MTHLLISLWMILLGPSFDEQILAPILFSPAVGGGGITLITICSASACTANSNSTGTISTSAFNAVAGNLIVIHYSGDTLASGTTVTCTDTAGDIFGKQVGIDNLGGSGTQVYSVLTAGNASNVVACVSTSTFVSAIVRQYHGVASATKDASATAVTTSTVTSLTTGTFTTTSASEVAVGGGFKADTSMDTWVAGAGYGHAVTVPLFFSGGEDQIFSTIQTGVTASISWGNAINNATFALVTFH